MKNYARLQGYQGPKGHFSGYYPPDITPEVTVDIDVFTDEP